MAAGRCELRRFDDGAMRNLFASRVEDDYVRAGIVRRVQPEVIRARDAKGQMIVVTRRAPD